MHPVETGSKSPSVLRATEGGRYCSAKFGQRQTESDLPRLEQSLVVAVGTTAANIETTRKRVDAARIARKLSVQTLDTEQKRLRASCEWREKDTVRLIIAAGEEPR